MFQLEFLDPKSGKWRLLGDDGNDFELLSEAWTEAVMAAQIGAPYNGAQFRVIDNGGEHQDDCGLGIGGPTCDCGGWVVISEGRVSWDGKLARVSFNLLGRDAAPVQWWPGTTRLDVYGRWVREAQAVSAYPAELVTELAQKLGRTEPVKALPAGKPRPAREKGKGP